LHDVLGRKLDAIGIDSQPEVVLRLIDLSTNKNAQLLDYAKVIRADQAISGRVLKLSNSALFAQRTAVTNLDRACTLLGIERLKVVTLGFHLSRAASGGTEKNLTRRVWGQSVFRACMAGEAAKLIAPSLVAEAFVIGLMMDAGIPLTAKILGAAYQTIIEDAPGPGKLYRREFDGLGFTHVDVVAALVKKWRFPELLARPLEQHHTRPADNAKDEPVHRLHRIAYVVGLLELDQEDMASPTMMAAGSAGGMVTAQRLLRVNDNEMGKLISSAVNEYNVMIEVFNDVAARLGNLEELVARVHNGLIDTVDSQLEESMARESNGVGAKVQKLTIHGSLVEIVRDSDGSVVAFLSDAEGKRLVSYRLASQAEGPEVLCEQLGLEAPSADDAGRIVERIRALAA